MTESIIKNCRQCGKQFIVDQRQNSERQAKAQFCSSQCRGKFSRKSENLCSMEGCNRRHQARKLCNAHYMRWLRLGDANISLTNQGVGKTFEERFWSRVNKNGTCWLWQGKPSTSGYGTVSYQGKYIGAHRIAWFLVFGKMPNLNILHSCDNPICVNPTHLRNGTNVENIADKVLRNRQAKGEKITISKLKDNEVREIRKNSQNLSRNDLAKIYNVTYCTIANIIKGISWKHLD